MDNLIGIAYPQWRELRRETNNDIDPTSAGSPGG